MHPEVAAPRAVRAQASLVEPDRGVELLRKAQPMMDVDEAAVEIHKTARDHGFWDKERNFGEMLMLVTSELAEALEEDRDGNPTVYFKCRSCGYWQMEEPAGDEMHYIALGVPCPSTEPLKPEGALVEVVDAIIRLLDTGQDQASRTRWTIGGVMRMKMDYNEQREAMHGKKY